MQTQVESQNWDKTSKERETESERKRHDGLWFVFLFLDFVCLLFGFYFALPVCSHKIQTQIGANIHS